MIDWLKWRIRKFVQKFKGTMYIGTIEIKIPKSYILPILMKQNKLYDRFLPVLASYFQKEDVVIDIGANIGDTIIAMLQSSSCSYVGIEPSDKFYKILEHNITFLPKELKNRVHYHKAMITTLKGSLKHNFGTASLDTSYIDDTIRTASLDELIDDDLVHNIKLIKVDIDGYDYDALLSSKGIIRKVKPILFWENEILSLKQKSGYEDLIRFLIENEYEYCYVFDNFGNLMLENIDFKFIPSLFNYIYSMNFYGHIRTIHYVDILAVGANHKDIVDLSIETYKNKFINKSK